jgi:hypothetical protein
MSEIKRRKRLEPESDSVQVMIRIPRKIYEAYAALRRLTTAYEIDRSFEETVNTVLRHKLEEFVIMINSVECMALMTSSEDDQQKGG